MDTLFSRGIWPKSWNAQDGARTRVICFRKTIIMPYPAERCKVRIFAVSKYKLYLNGNLICCGPQKGDRNRLYYDEIEIKEGFQSGENLLAAEVLHYPSDPDTGNHSMVRPGADCFILKGECTDCTGRLFSFETDESWMCCVRRSLQFPAEESVFSPLMIHEEQTEREFLRGWKRSGTGFCDDSWERVILAEQLSEGKLMKRTIPFPYRKRRCFTGVKCLRKSVWPIEEWDQFLKKGKPIVIPAGTEEIIEIDAGEEMNGYLRLLVSDGAGTMIEFLESEAYVLNHPGGSGTAPVKNDRADCEEGHLGGYTDRYLVSGDGTQEEPEEIEPFWFRTFRYLRLRVITDQEPVKLLSFYYDETGYPLEMVTQVHTADPSLETVWEISARTLNRCMHETYMDCPFYEQLQYSMDARSEILYTYAVSSDDRLARACMEDFRHAVRADGTINCSYPNCHENVIPGFGIYYILMVSDHMMYFGDRELVKHHFPAIQKILQYFEEHLTKQGYAGKLGGINKDICKTPDGPYWSFIDWTTQWEATDGMPSSGLGGPVTVESLLYLLGLQHAIRLAEYAYGSDSAVIDTMTRRADNLKTAIRTYCLSTDGMIQDSPGVNTFSQHGQVFGVLTGTLSKGEGKKALLKTLQAPDEYAQCSVAMQLYLFRALEETGLYDQTEQLWNIWKRMAKRHATTCVESESYPRSECHGWGALALYEFPSSILGVRPAAPGFEKARIRPLPTYLQYAEGTVSTPNGKIYVSWKLENGRRVVQWEAPAEMEIISS